jgi:hypothetical protein
MCNGLADLTQANRVDEPSPVPSTLAGETSVRVWIDAQHPVVQTDFRSASPIHAEAAVEIWRTETRMLDRKEEGETESHSSYGNFPENLQVHPFWESLAPPWAPSQPRVQGGRGAFSGSIPPRFPLKTAPPVWAGSHHTKNANSYKLVRTCVSRLPIPVASAGSALRLSQCR